MAKSFLKYDTITRYTVYRDYLNVYVTINGTEVNVTDGNRQYMYNAVITNGKVYVTGFFTGYRDDAASDTGTVTKVRISFVNLGKYFSNPTTKGMAPDFFIAAGTEYGYTVIPKNYASSISINKSGDDINIEYTLNNNILKKFYIGTGSVTTIDFEEGGDSDGIYMGDYRSGEAIITLAQPFFITLKLE